MIAWSGVGFFVAVLISAAYLLCKWLLDIYYYDGFFVSHLWATGATLIVSALFCAAFVWVLRQEKWLDSLAQATKSQPMMAPKKPTTSFLFPFSTGRLFCFCSAQGSVFTT